MKRKVFTCLVFAALMGAGMVSVTSCADYDEDIMALQNQINAQGSVQETLKTQLEGMSSQIAALQASLNAMKTCQCGDVDQKIADQISKALASLNYATPAEVAEAIDKALAGIKTGLTQAEVEALIKAYHDAHPGCSCGDIETLIKKYLAENPGLSESDVEAIVKAYHDAHPTSTLSEADVKSIVETYINQLQHFTKEQIEGMINTAITQALANYVQKGDVYTKAEVEALVDAAVKNIQPGLTEDEVKALIDAALMYVKVGLSESEVKALIDAAVKNIKPGLTTEEVQALIDAAVKNVKPGLTAEEVQALIDAAKCQCPDGLTTQEVTTIATAVIEKYMKEHPFVLDTTTIENICNTTINNSQIISNLQSSITTLQGTVDQVKNDLKNLKDNVYTKTEVENLINTLIAQAISGLTPSGSLSPEQQAIINSLINTAISNYNATHPNCNCEYDDAAFKALAKAVAENAAAIQQLQPKGDYVTNAQLEVAIEALKALIPSTPDLSQYVTIATYNQDLIAVNQAIADAAAKAQQALNKANANAQSIATLSGIISNLRITVNNLSDQYITLSTKLDDTTRKAADALAKAQSNYTSIVGLQELYESLLKRVQLVESQGYDDTAIKERLTAVEEELKTLKTQLGTLATKEELVEQIDKVKTLVEEAKTYAQTVASNAANDALAEAKAYADGVANGVYNDAKDYADQVAATALLNAKEYADGQYNKALDYADGKYEEAVAAAQKYADDKYAEALAEAKKLADGAYKSAKDYADQKYQEALKAAQDALAESKKYADEQDKKVLADAEKKAKEIAEAAYNKALNDAKEIMYGEFKNNVEAYARQQAEQAKKDAMAYTDGKIAGVYKDAVDYADNKAAEVLQQAKNYTDSKISSVTSAFQSADNLLQGQINTINGELTTINSTLTSLQDQIDELSDKVNALTKVITGIELQGSVNPTFGYYSLPLGITSNVLIAYYGENSRKTTFPDVEDSDLEYSEEENWITYEDADRLGYRSYIINGGSKIMGGEGNAGKLYLTLNPSNVDFTGTSLKLVNSLGEESPVTLSALKKSTDKLTFGQSRAASNTYFYEATATVDQSKTGAANYAINKQLTTVLEEIVKDKAPINISDLAQAVYNQFNGVLDAYAVQATWNDANGEHTVTSNYGIAATAIKPLGYHTLRDFSTKKLPTITPLSELNIDLKKIIDPSKFNFTLPDVNPNISIKFDFSDLYTDSEGNIWSDITVTSDNSYEKVPMMIMSASEIKSNDEVIEDVIKLLNNRADAWDTQLQAEFEKTIKDNLEKMQRKLKDAVADINGKLQGSISEMIDIANNKLNSTLGKTDQFIKQLNHLINEVDNLLGSGNPNIRLQAQLFYPDANDLLHPMSNAKGWPTILSGDGEGVELSISSYTGEILAPSFKKYVAVTNVYRGDDDADSDPELMKALQHANNVEGFNEVISGDRYAVVFSPDKSVKGAVYEIVYSSLDYYGSISQRKYYVTFE